MSNRPVYLAIGIDCEGARQVLGLRAGPSTGEPAKFWLSVLSELKGRGVADVCIVCCDGLTGLPDAIGVIWPQAVVQLCVVHYPDTAVMPIPGPSVLAGGGDRVLGIGIIERAAA